MSKSEPFKLKEEIERGFQFLTTLDQNGEVYKAIFTLLSDLRNKAGKDGQPLLKSGVTDTSIDGNPTRQDHETILIAIHKAMCEEKFICIYEKPSSVPGFSAPIKELPPYQLPPGWNADPNSYALTYKHKQKPGKQFMLTCSVLADGTILNVTVTEKNGLSLAVELEVDDFTDQTQTVEGRELALKTHIQALVRQLVPPLATPTPSSSTPQSLRAPPVQQAPHPINPYDNPFSDGRGGFIPTPIVPPVGGYMPRFPGVGGGDLHPTFPGALPQGMPDFGQGSLVGPNHPLFSPNMGGYPDDPRAPPGWPVGMPRPRFDSFMPVPGPNGPDFGQQGQGPPFGPNGGRGMRRRVPGEPDPDHLLPPGANDNMYM